MVLGIGIDNIEVARVEQRLRKEDGLKEQLFTPREIAYCESKVHSVRHYAARFASKEAFLKAIGRGLVDGSLFREIEIVSNQDGGPQLMLHGRARKMAETLGINNVQVALSSTKELAGAVVTLETEKGF